jgi:hypothetical protein
MSCRNHGFGPATGRNCHKSKSWKNQCLSARECPSDEVLHVSSTYPFKPDWTKHVKDAPFKRNDQILDVLPIGVTVFPGTGIQDNLGDKARKLGIPVWKFRSGSA